jgi:hypothetical protein
MAKLEGRTYQPGDEHGIVNLYNSITKRKRSVEQHRWEWLNTPEGVGSIWVIVERDSKSIVGHHGLIPIRMNCFGKVFLAGKTENTILHPKYMGTGVYFLHERRFLEQALKRFDLLFTNFAYGTPGKIRRKLGYQEVGRYSTYKKVTGLAGLRGIINREVENYSRNKPLKVFLKCISYLVIYVLGVIFSKRKRSNEPVLFETVEDIKSVYDEIDEFWQNNKGNYGITIDRSAKYLEWRIFTNPYLKHNFLIARRNEEIVGYIICKSVSEEDETGVIIDAISENNDENTLGCMFAEAVDRFKKRGVKIVVFSTLLENRYFDRVLRRQGFVASGKIGGALGNFSKSLRVKDEPMLLVRISNKAVECSRMYNPYCWYYTQLFTEGIR